MIRGSIMPHTTKTSSSEAPIHREEQKRLWRSGSTSSFSCTILARNLLPQAVATFSSPSSFLCAISPVSSPALSSSSLSKSREHTYIQHRSQACCYGCSIAHPSSSWNAVKSHVSIAATTSCRSCHVGVVEGRQMTWLILENAADWY